MSLGRREHSVSSQVEDLCAVSDQRNAFCLQSGVGMK